jgi:hypothetical protein
VAIPCIDQYRKKYDMRLPLAKLFSFSQVRLRGRALQSTSQVNSDTVHDQTVRWVESFVVEHNLCPFAKASLPSLEVRVFKETDVKVLEAFVIDAANELAKSKTAGTIIIAAPYVDDVVNFLDYLNVVDSLETEFFWNGLEGSVQLATFHPQYQFSDAEPDCITNWTNRSPWPLFHLLRENEVTAAIKSYGDTEQIWQRNKETMRRLGPDGVGEHATPASK